MRLASAYVVAAVAIFRRDLRMFTSYRFQLAAPLLTAVFTITLFHFISRLVNADSVGSRDEYYAYVVVGIVILGVVVSTLVTPSITLRQELVAGTFERLVLSPFGAVRAVVAMMIFPFVLACFLSLIILVFSSLVFGVPVSWATAPLAIPVAFLGAAAFLPFGLLLLSAVLVLKQANAGSSFVVAGIALVAGIYFPVTLLPSWIRWASEIQPFTPTADLMRHLLIDAPLMDPAGVDVLKLVLFALVLIPLSLWALAGAVQRGRRRATITEY